MINEIANPLTGQPYDTRAWLRNNRTGATVVEGSIGCVDTPQGDAASTSINLGLSNVVAVTTALITKAPVVVCVLKPGQSGADDKVQSWAEGEAVYVDKLRVEGTTDNIAKGDPLKLVNAQAYAVKATAGTDRWHAVALEAYEANDALGLIAALLFSYGRF